MVKRAFWLVIVIAFVPVEGRGADVPTLEESRGIAMQLQVRLKQELDAALASGGPIAAISVCSERAVAIAAELTQESGARVSRTSQKVRNPANAAEPWQVEGLERLEQMAIESAAAGTTHPLELWDPAPGVQGVAARYLRAITTAPMCLVCHGQTLAPDLEAAIAERYPDDLATGYDAGSIRGALSVVWPAIEGPEVEREAAQAVEHAVGQEE